MTDILLMGVIATHRDVVGSFRLSWEVSNLLWALLAETEVNSWINPMENKKDKTPKFMAQGSGPPIGFAGKRKREGAKRPGKCYCVFPGN